MLNLDVREALVTWSGNEDAFREINGQPGGIAAPYDRDIGWPWGMKRFVVAPRLGPLHARRLRGPASGRAGDTARVLQTAFSSGRMGL